MNVVVIGAGTPHLAIADCVTLGDIADARFDGPSETWTLTAADGRHVTAALVVDTRPSTDPAIATHGRPNYFRIPGPDTARQARYVARCLRLAEKSGAGRIEAKRPILLRRWLPQQPASQFSLSGSEPGPDDLYDGPAIVTVDGRDVETRVRLIGHLDPIDGQYHWQGTVFESLSTADRGRPVTVRIGDRAAGARVAEQTPWGASMVVGVGVPPFDC